jgi:hypothetical protein
MTRRNSSNYLNVDRRRGEDLVAESAGEERLSVGDAADTLPDASD